MAKFKPWETVWQLGERLGGGGQGDTYIAHRKNDRKKSFALKKLRNNDDEDRRERMYVEVANLQILKHPNIPRFIESNAECYKDKNIPLYLVTEYIPGPTLQQFIDTYGVLSLSDALNLSIKLADAVSYCHKKNSCHRDIKPDNIILNDGDIKDPYLIDFGLSFNQELLKENETPSWQHIGNRFLSLPELRVLEANKRDYRSDVTYVCGIFLFCLTGAHPVDLIDSNNTKPHRRKISSIILQGLEKNKLAALNYIFDIGFNQGINERWQSIESLQHSLIDLLNLPEKEMPEESNLSKKVEQLKKSIEDQYSYKQSQDLDTLFGKFESTLSTANRNVIKELGINFGSIQTSRTNDYVKQVFSNSLGIKNKLLTNLTFFPRFSLYINGSEIVIEAIESDIREELLRHPLSEQIDWLNLLHKIREYYINGLLNKNASIL